MTVLSQDQLYALARQAGLSDSRAMTAAAIAVAESGGNSQAHNATPPDDSYGLWQINMLGSLGPSRRALYGLKANTDLFDPATNARVMSAISKQGQNFNPWTTYTSGAYKQYLGLVKNRTPDPAPAGGGLVDDAKSLATFAYRSSDALVRTGRWVTTEKNWLRVGEVLLGGTAILLGLVAVIRTSEAGRAGLNVTKNVAKKAAKKAKAAAVAA